ncbi:Homeobox protein tos8 [Stygiomarasmius scandens]|uniref:Homeobox protein tos8 n=1 Tax=Marasmiellus scandens TaxID=2682957 RepID=A0ABR1IJX2_9AGAR
MVDLDEPGSLVDRPQRKRGKLPKETTDYLKAWLHKHTENPYPTEEEMQQLCHATGLSMPQVSNWMINTRRRLLLPAESSHDSQSFDFPEPSDTTFDPPWYTDDLESFIFGATSHVSSCDLEDDLESFSLGATSNVSSCGYLEDIDDSQFLSLSTAATNDYSEADLYGALSNEIPCGDSIWEELELMGVWEKYRVRQGW